MKRGIWIGVVIGLLGLGFGSGACSASAPAVQIAPVAPEATAAAPLDAEQRVTAMVRSWLTLLESRSRESSSASLPPLASGFALFLADGVTRGPTDIGPWLDDRRTSHPQVEFQLDSLRIAPVEDDLYRARFAIDRHAHDAADALHLARWEHVWLVRSPPGAHAEILRIEERPALPFPGTGTRIICN